MVTGVLCAGTPDCTSTRMRFSEQDYQGSFSGDRFCHQFLLGPEFVDNLAGWQNVKVSESLMLMAHPELTVEQVTDGCKSITLIGYILDPGCPKKDNVGIIQSLLAGFSTIKQLISATARLGGRWVVIADDGEQVVLFNDALGLRQVFYTAPDYREGLWVMSQPGILAWLKELSIDDAALSFIDSYEVRNQAEYRWPGTATAFSEIIHLLPNHCLNLSTGKCRRYWPMAPIKARGLDEVVDEAIEMLQGLMDAAGSRFDLVLGMTAGYDSRIVLSASRSVLNKLSAITVRQGGMPDTHQDPVIAARLLGRLGIRHDIVRALPYMSAAFSKTFKENVFLAHDHYGPDAEAILDCYGRQKVVVTGSGAEVAREPFRKRIDSNKRHYTAQDLASLQWMGNNQFAVQSFQQWLDEFDESCGIHLLDLFSWEQSHGNWLAGTQMEFDIAWRDIFTPFNCRELLVCLMSVDEHYRSSPDHKLFKMLIEKMWPELMGEPINPQDGNKKHGSRKVMRKTASAVKNRLARLGMSIRNKAGAY